MESVERRELSVVYSLWSPRTRKSTIFPSPPHLRDYSRLSWILSIHQPPHTDPPRLAQLAPSAPITQNRTPQLDQREQERGRREAHQACLGGRCFFPHQEQIKDYHILQQVLEGGRFGALPDRK